MSNKNKKQDLVSIERKRISRDLHDVVANELLHFQFMFVTLEHNIDTELFVKMTDRLNFIRNQVRTISHSLVEPYLDNEADNLVEVVKTLLIDYSHLMPTISFDFNHFPTYILGANYDSTEILIIIKELINNSVSHSSCDTIDVNITENENNITLVIEDNGIGFDNNKKNTGIGLLNLAERINQLGGSLTIESLIGRGSVFVMELFKKSN